jgi:hypothetical protein
LSSEPSRERGGLGGGETILVWSTQDQISLLFFRRNDDARQKLTLLPRGPQQAVRPPHAPPPAAYPSTDCLDRTNHDGKTHRHHLSPLAVSHLRQNTCWVRERRRVSPYHQQRRVSCHRDGSASPGPSIYHRVDGTARWHDGGASRETSVVDDGGDDGLVRPRGFVGSVRPRRRPSSPSPFSAPAR